MSNETDRFPSRRAALIRLGALAFGTYTAPAFTTLSIAEAKGSGSDSGSSGASGSDNSGSGSSNSGSGSNNSGSGSSNSGSGSSNSGSGSGTSGTSGTSNATTSSGGKSTVFGGDGIHVQFADGHTERIRNGVFERTDRRGRIVERHAARQSDVRRLRRLRMTARDRKLPKDIRAVVEIDELRGHIEITDYRGWHETVSGSTYELKDPNGRTVTRRALTAKDIFRIRDALNVD